MECNSEKLLVETSDGKEPEGCGSYNHINGYSKDTNKPCDMCFMNDLVI